VSCLDPTRSYFCLLFPPPPPSPPFCPFFVPPRAPRRTSVPHPKYPSTSNRPNKACLVLIFLCCFSLFLDFFFEAFPFFLFFFFPRLGECASLPLKGKVWKNCPRQPPKSLDTRPPQLPPFSHFFFFLFLWGCFGLRFFFSAFGDELEREERSCGIYTSLYEIKVVFPGASPAHALPPPWLNFDLPPPFPPLFVSSGALKSVL